MNASTSRTVALSHERPMATRKSSHTISVYAYRFHVPGSEVAIFPSRKNRLIRWSGRPDGERAGLGNLGVLFTDPGLKPLDRTSLLDHQTRQVVVRHPALGQTHGQTHETLTRRSHKDLSGHRPSTVRLEHLEPCDPHNLLAGRDI